MNIPVANPGAAYRAYKVEIDEALARILDSGWYILGSSVKAFENDFAAFCHTKYALGVANGTDADELALRAVGVVAGSKVATVSNTANATVSAIERIGATPVFIDVEPDTQNMSSKSLSVAIAENKIDAVIAVHLFGHPADIPAIKKLMSPRGIPLVEDCAQAHGAEIDGLMVGSLSDVAAFSFYPTKNLGALGDGGAVVTSIDEYADKVALLRQYGWRSRYSSEIKGVNSRLDELQAAILSVKLAHLDECTARRREIARRYNESFANLPITLPAERPGFKHVYHQYVIQTEDRDRLSEFLKSKGVGTAILYPTPIHKQPAYLADYGKISLPETEALSKKILSLPVYPELTDEEVGFVIETVKSFF